MSPENFAYWLQGYLEIGNIKKLDEKQIQIIKDHLKQVFTKVTPDRNKPGLLTEQDLAEAISLRHIGPVGVKYC